MRSLAYKPLKLYGVSVYLFITLHVNKLPYEHAYNAVLIRIFIIKSCEDKLVNKI